MTSPKTAFQVRLIVTLDVCGMLPFHDSNTPKNMEVDLNLRKMNGFLFCLVCMK